MNSIAENNKAHHAALAVVENAVRNGVKIKFGKGVGCSSRGVNTKPVKEHKGLLALKPLERFKCIISTHLQLTRGEVSSYTELSLGDVSKLSTKLEAEGFIKKEMSSSTGMGKEVVYVYVGK